jgi:glyoxylase-like metal-dependent hydrolase (beta-lactamase superfamily II)
VEQFLLSKLANSGAEQLAKVVDELPRKLLVFLTHHHYDHIDGMDSLKLINSFLCWSAQYMYAEGLCCTEFVLPL